MELQPQNLWNENDEKLRKSIKRYKTKNMHSLQRKMNSENQPNSIFLFQLEQ